MSWTQAFSAHFGPDGSLYVIDFGAGSGTGRGGSNDGAGIYRIDYVANGRRPNVKATPSVDNGRYPLTVSFSSNGSAGGDGEAIDYAWDFDGDGTVDSTEANPTHVYDSPGQFDARLTVRSRTNGLTGVAVTTVTAGNTRPDVRIDIPADGGVFDWGDTIPFQVHVTDREDGRIDCSKVVVQTQLGHDAHLHPMDNLTGCFGEAEIDQGNSHGPGQNLYVALSAQYTDGGGPRGVPALTGSAHLSLQPRRKEAEHFTQAGGPNGTPTITTAADASAGKRVGGIKNGSWVMFDPVNLTGTPSVTVGAGSGGLGGTVEFHADSPTGQLLGTVAIPNTGGWGNVISPTVVLTNPGRTVKLYAVFTNPAWTPTSPDLMSYDWFQFNGTGVSKPGTTVVATATPTTPGTFAFSGTTSGPVTAYSWDFGDNTPAVSGVTANHTYARKGTYTARLTTTDSEGVHNSGIVQVVVP
ncbi:hypothetical protein GCM10029964_018000 [Kibdelosporangium lantanae]